MKRTEGADAQKQAKLAQGSSDKTSNVIGFAQYKERQVVDEYRKALQLVVANAQKADW
ncbi:hypothetical protein [Pseudomonas sp. Ost2]|uniref:hypothetical protein n=1 Tax=Pseudomonas sp. Ost2 TaxID=2678260 RepID=UPI001BB39B84|nr:hypothetical protein [Pseudomonas sp. Ost2]